jgi:hypothetical protein
MRVGAMRDRIVLLDVLPRGSVGAEIGVFRGGYSLEILASVKPAKLHLIDEWPPRVTCQKPEQFLGTENHRFVLERFRHEIAAGIVVVHRARSPAAADGFPDGHFDWVYIDADHTYEAVRDDLAAWRPKVKPGGLVMGHDYCQPKGRNYGVIRAVADSVERGELQMVGITGEAAFPSFVTLRIK